MTEQTNVSMAPEILTPAQAAAYLGVSERTLRRMRSSGSLSVAMRRLGGRIGYDRFELHRLRAAKTPRARTNLTRRRSRFYGRIEEFAAIRSAWLEHRHLVTLVAPSGHGKSRLAEQLAWGEAQAYAGFREVWRIDVADRGDGSVTALLARTLGIVRSTATSHQVEAIESELLSRGAVLLVVDGCEGAPEQIASLLDNLLSRCPKLVVLATAHAPLGCDDEYVVSIGPLTSKKGVQSPAARLFFDRAQILAAPRESELAIALQVADVVGGSPLAIELAAAQYCLSGSSIAGAILESPLVFLTRASAITTCRHQSLRAAMQWTWRHLPQWAQLALAQLSVVAESFDVEAAQSVLCLGDEPCAPAPAHAVVGLRQRGLLEAASSARMRMAESVRAFAREKLAELGDEQAVQQRYRESAGSQQRRPDLEIAEMRRAEQDSQWGYCELHATAWFADGSRRDLKRYRVASELLVALIRAGQPVNQGSLARTVWGLDDYHQLADGPRLYRAVGRLRRLLDGERDRPSASRIVTSDAGYHVSGDARLECQCDRERM